MLGCVSTQPLDPLRFMLIGLVGWINEQQRDVIDLQEENRVLRDQLGNKRLRLSNEQRRRLAVKAKKLGRKALTEVASIISPDTLLTWHRKLIARKYDGSKRRGPGRPRVMHRIRELVVRLPRKTVPGAIPGFEERWPTSCCPKTRSDLNLFSLRKLRPSFQAASISDFGHSDGRLTSNVVRFDSARVRSRRSRRLAQPTVARHH